MRILIILCLMGFVCIQGSAFVNVDNDLPVDRVFPGFTESSSQPLEPFVADTREIPVSFLNAITAMHNQWLKRQHDPQMSHSCLLENNEKSEQLIRQSLRRLKRVSHVSSSFSAAQVLLVFWGELYAECSDSKQLINTLAFLKCDTSHNNIELKNHCSLLKLASKENYLSCHHQSLFRQFTYFDVSGCQSFHDEVGDNKEVMMNTLLMASQGVLALIVGYLVGNRWWVITMGSNQ